MSDILYGIKNLIFYFKVIWNDRAWDYIYLLKLLDKKLEQIELHLEDKYFGKHIATEGEEKVKEKLIKIRNKLQEYIEEGEMSVKQGERLFKKLGRLIPYLWD